MRSRTSFLQLGPPPHDPSDEEAIAEEANLLGVVPPELETGSASVAPPFAAGGSTAAPKLAVGSLLGETEDGLVPDAERRALAQGLLDDYKNQHAAAQSATRAGGRLESTAPSWYKGGAPPKQSGDWGGLARSLGGALGAGARFNASNPNRPAYMRADDAQRAGLLEAVGGFAGSFLDKDKTNYNNELEAAGKQAAMNKTLSGGGAASNGSLSSGVGLLNALGAEETRARLAKVAKAKADREEAINSPDSPESNSLREALLRSGNVTPEQVAGLSYTDLDKARTAFMQTHHEDFRANEADRGRNNQEAVKVRDVNRDVLVKNDDEAQKEQRRRDQAKLPQGYDWEGGVPPAEPVVEKVRSFLDARQVMMDGTNRLLAIQKELGDKYTWGELNGRLAQYVGSDEHKKLIERAAAEQVQLTTAMRHLQNMGVFNAGEGKIVNSQVPMAGSVQGWLKGAPAWQGVRDAMDDRSKVFLKTHKVRLPGESGPNPPAKADQRQPVTFEPPPEIPYQPKRASSVNGLDGLGVAPMPPAPALGAPPSSAADKAKYDEAQKRAGARRSDQPVPAPTAPAQAPAKLYQVTSKADPTKSSKAPRPLTDEQVQRLTALGTFNITQVQ